MQWAQQNPTDPPGTPPASSSSIIMHDERSDNRSSADLNTIYSGKPIGVVGAPKKIPSAFNRTRPTPTVAPRVLFPPQQNFDGKIPRGGHISPPSVRRRSQEENTVFLWELEDEDDIPSDSSAEHHVVSSLGLSDPAVPLSGNVNTQKERGEDATSDPGYNYYSRVTTYPNTTPMRQKKSSSDAAGPTSSPSFNNYRGQNNETHATRWGNNTTKDPSNGNIPQSPDEHTARLKEIMDKRDKKKRKKKKRSNHNADDSDDYGSSVVSGLSSNTRTSSNVSSYADDPINYLNEMLHGSSEKKKNSDAASAVSRGSKGSAVSSLSNGSKTSSKASYGSDVSGGSNTSSIFASTRAKLKGYLTSYKKKDKKDIPREPNKSTKAAASPFSPARGSPSAGTQTTQGTPSTLFSIDESEPDSTLKQTRSNNSLLTPARSGNRKSFEEKILHLSTPPTSSSSSSNAKIHLPRIHCAVESDTTTQVISLPWSHDSKDASIDDIPITGLYSGPVNELLQPHGKGKLVLEGNNSSLALYGTWEGGKLVSPLTDEKEPVTDDEDESDEPFPDSPIRRMREKPSQTYTSATPNNSAPPVTSIKYAVNSHNCKISMDTAITSEVRDKAAKKRRKQIMPLVRYDIGDACRTPQDMIIYSSKREATESAGLLRKWDGAFIKRSCGVWTYAVLIERALQPMDVERRRLEYLYWATVSEVDPCHEMEDSMLFAIDEDGSTKIIPKRAWSKYIRRIQRNPVPNIPRDPLPTEVTTKPSSQEEHSSCNDSGFDGKFASLDDSQRESKVYPC